MRRLQACGEPGGPHSTRAGGAGLQQVAASRGRKSSLQAIWLTLRRVCPLMALAALRLCACLGRGLPRLPFCAAGVLDTQ
jgi:hypothetical protein